MADSMKFTFAGRTIDYFGSKSISSDITALFELIKNSRDANARNVRVHFKNPRSTSAELEISDDGDGMTESDVRTKWMVIGTDTRKHNVKTRRGKPVWGEMGIGRMACQKLGGITEFDTVKDAKRVRMEFDWSVFEKPGITVDRIEFPMKSTDEDVASAGTKLVIKKLKSEWSSVRINSLKQELSLLMSKDIFDDIRIAVKVGNADDEPIGKEHASVRERITDNAPFKVRGKFDGNILRIEIMNLVGQQARWVKQDIVDSYHDTGLGPFSVEIYHFPRGASKQKSSILETYHEKKYGTGSLEGFLQENYGVYIYRDGAWLRPYGRDVDWLSLEAGARQETAKIGLKQVYGVLHLTKSDNPKIEPASHRETLIENAEFADLKTMMKIVFRTLSAYMKDWKLKQKESSKVVSGKTNVETADAMAKNITKRLSKLPEEDRKAVRLSCKGLVNLVGDSEESRESTIADIGEIRSYEKNLVTLGIATSFMARHITEPLEENRELVAEGALMREDIKTRDLTLTDEQMARTEKMLEIMNDNQDRMLHFMKFVSVMTDHIAQSITRNKKPIQVDIEKCWESVAHGFEDRCNDLNVEVRIDASNPRNRNAGSRLVVKIDPIDLESILINLYLNSLFAIEKSKGTMRVITLHYWHHNNELNVEFSDTGRGIPRSKLKEIFEPFKFGHSQTSKELHGHGLGLYIVKKIMDHYEGTAEAVEMEAGARIKLVFQNIKKVATG